MANERRIPNYRKIYPTASEEIIAVLKQGERKLHYHEYDLKTERFHLDETKQQAIFIPSKEDSLERLIENEVQFTDPKTNVEEDAIKKLMIEQLKESLNLLSTEDHELIFALFFEGFTEREYANYKGVYHNAIHKKKLRILEKLKSFLEK